MNMIKMETLERDIIELFRQFKLGNSLFRDVVRISPDEQEYHKNSAIDHDAKMKAERRQRLAEFILMHEESATKTITHRNGDVEYITELLVLKLEDFKTIVEAAISLIPDAKIQEIKQGKSI